MQTILKEMASLMYERQRGHSAATKGKLTRQYGSAFRAAYEDLEQNVLLKPTQVRNERRLNPKALKDDVSRFLFEKQLYCSILKTAAILVKGGERSLYPLLFELLKPLFSLHAGKVLLEVGLGEEVDGVSILCVRCIHLFQSMSQHLLQIVGSVGRRWNWECSRQLYRRSL